MRYIKHFWINGGMSESVTGPDRGKLPFNLAWDIRLNSVVTVVENQRVAGGIQYIFTPK